MEVCPYDEQPLIPLARSKSLPPPNQTKHSPPDTVVPQPSKPRGMPAIAIVAILALLGLAMLCLLLPVLAAAQSKALRIHCATNLKQISNATRAWSDAHQGKLPESCLDLSNEMIDPAVFVCPEDKKRFPLPRSHPAVWDTNNCSYEFPLAGALTEPGDKRVIVRCPIHRMAFNLDGLVK